MIHSFEFASDTVKNILTLSTAILTLTVTFAKDYLLQKSRKVSWSLGTSWILFLISIFGGVWTLMALTGELSGNDPANASIWKPNVIIPAIIQCITFVLALIFTVWAGWRSVSSKKLTQSDAKHLEQ